MVDFAFSSAHPFFCYPLLPYYSIIPVVKLFASILLGLFRPAIYSSPNGPVRPLVFLLHHWRAFVSHLFFLGGLGPVCFPWASPALSLTLHSHRLLLNSLGFPDPITLSLILGAHGLTINPLLSLLSLLWACRGPFSLFHIICCPWFAFSLFPGSLKPIYLHKAHLFISWAYDPLFLPLGLNEFSIYLPNSFLSMLLGFFFPLGLPKWPLTLVNQTQKHKHKLISSKNINTNLAADLLRFSQTIKPRFSQIIKPRYTKSQLKPRFSHLYEKPTQNQLKPNTNRSSTRTQT